MARVNKAAMVAYIVSVLKQDPELADIPDVRLTMAVDRALTSHVLKQLDSIRAANTLNLCKCLLDVFRLRLKHF